MARRSKGDGGLYQRADGMWVGTVELGWTPDGKRRRKVVTHRTQAGALAKLREVRRAVDRYGTVPTGSPTVEVWLNRWLTDIAAPRVKPLTLNGYISKAKLITEAIGRVRLDKLTAQHVRTMQRHAAADGRSSTTALACHRILRKALEDAMREGILIRNVADLVDAPSKAAHEHTPLSADHARILLRSVADDPLAARWALALLYGVRQGEAIGLTWQAVDIDAGVIDLEWQLMRLTWRHGCGPVNAPTCGRKRGKECPHAHQGIPAGMEVRHLEGAYVLARPKRDKARRVPLIGVMADALLSRAAIAAEQPNPHGLVFARPDGSPINPRDDNLAWHAHLDAAGLPSVRLHDARHTTATLLLEAGVDAEVIRAILGHSAVTMTRAYQTVSLSLSRTALEGLGRTITAGEA